jgi:hypothetical protein
LEEAIDLSRDRQILDLEKRIIFKQTLEEKDGVVWTGLIWFRIEKSGGLL